MQHDFLNHAEILCIKQGIPSNISSGRSASIRGIEKKSQVINDFIFSEKILSYVSQFLNENVQFVRAILFDKTSQNNWLVAWHQDRTVAVSNKFELKGWNSWSIKDNTHHVQPPVEVLDEMVTCRIHLDSNTIENGCLKLIPGSHRYGVLSHDEIQKVSVESEVINCIGDAGSMLVMRPHILHASSKMTDTVRRRVLHIEYTSYSLPNEIKWA